jgi:hypothetical protein
MAGLDRRWERELTVGDLERDRVAPIMAQSNASGMGSAYGREGSRGEEQPPRAHGPPGCLVGMGTAAMNGLLT